jgi:hypothetical protein
MAYRPPSASACYAREFVHRLASEINTYIPACSREDVRDSLIASHQRINKKVLALLGHHGFEYWDDLYNVTAQELIETNILDFEDLFSLVSYAHQLSLLLPDDSKSEQVLKSLLNPLISNSDLIAFQSEVKGVNEFLNSPVRKWSEVEQKIFCRIFFADEQPHRLAKSVMLSGAEVLQTYKKLQSDFRSLSFLGELVELMQNLEYRVLSRWKLIQDYPELDIRPFDKFASYRVLDILLILMQVRQYGDSVIDLSRGAVAKDILREFKGQLLPLDGSFSSTSSALLVQPEIRQQYFDLLGFKTNHIFRAYPAMSQREILVEYLKHRGSPAKGQDFKSDLVGFLDSKSMNQKVIETRGDVIPITKTEYALKEWGYPEFTGVAEIISEYVKENGPTHVEMLFAILDGYGFSEKRIRVIASEPPFALIDDVCVLMDTEDSL